jgi:hypothetical protein
MTILLLFKTQKNNSQYNALLKKYAYFNALNNTTRLQFTNFAPFDEGNSFYLTLKSFKFCKIISKSIKFDFKILYTSIIVA